MGDYGFRISKDGQDVKTASDLDCVITSKYANLKGSLSGTVALSKTGDYQRKTLVAHNLGYIPMVQVFMEGQYGAGVWEQLQIAGVSVEADSTNIYIYFWYGVANGDYNFKYFIFIDKGKL